LDSLLLSGDGVDLTNDNCLLKSYVVLPWARLPRPYRRRFAGWAVYLGYRIPVSSV